MEKDKLLYKRFVEGDMPAFEELVLTHKDNLIYFLMRYINDVHTCEDIAQDSFVTVFVKKGSYNCDDVASKGASFKTYLYAIAKNKATDHIRKFSRISSANDNESQANDNLTSDENELFNKVVKNEEQKMLYTAIKKLKLDYQKAVLLIDIDGLSYLEAAAVLGKSLPQIKILVFRARNALKNLLVKEGYTNENR